MKKIALLAVVAVALVGLLAATGLAKKEKEQQGWLGVYTQSVDYDLAEAFDLDVPYGAVVNDVVNDSPADEAGLRDGDVIISLNGEKVTDSNDLIDLMLEVKPDEQLTLVVVRDGSETTFTLTAGEAPARRDINWYHDDDGVSRWTMKQGTYPYLGVIVDDLNDQLGEYFGVADGRGALIEQVEKDSPAEAAGLKAGDVIVELDGERVAEAGDVSELVHDFEEGETVAISVVRERQTKNLQVVVGSREQPYFGKGFYFGPDQARIHMPELRGLFHGKFLHNLDIDFDSEEFDADMKELAEELSKLKVELGDVHRGGFDSDELRRDMEELRRELQDLKRELKRDLQEINDHLQ